VALLEISGLCVDIQQGKDATRLLSDVSVAVSSGETVGLVGESGSGKTMTGLSILGLLPRGGRVTSGRIVFNGRDLTQLSDDEMSDVRGSEIGVVLQDPMTSLNPTMRIGAQIAESARRHSNASRRSARDRAIDLLGLVGIPRPVERVDDYPHELSGGMRQRAMIAIALACDPALLIADEPTTALDVSIQAQILSLLDRLKAELGMTMILITHDLGVIAGRADRVIVMYAGRVVETSTTETLFATPAHPYTEALLAAIPRLDNERGTPLKSVRGSPPNPAARAAGCRFAPRCDFATSRCLSQEPTLIGMPIAVACFHPRSNAGRSSASGQPIPAADRSQPRGAPTRSVVLDVRNVSKTFPLHGRGLLGSTARRVQAVTGVSLGVREAETLGVVGESGCGKSTLARLLVGLERPTAGAIKYDGEDINAISPRALRRKRAGLQMMFQDPYASLDPRMSVGAILREPLAIQGVGSRASQERRVLALLDEVGLPRSAVDRRPHEFSGGQRQRIGLARALALRPSVIVADEPVSALDVSIQAQILNLMIELQRSHAMTYVFISHDLSVVRYLADRVAVMYLGQLVELADADVLYRHPLHPYTAGLLGAIPRPSPTQDRSQLSRGIPGELPSPADPPSGCPFRTRCERATDRCSSERPALSQREDGHFVACHFPLAAPAAPPHGTAGDCAVRT